MDRGTGCGGFHVKKQSPEIRAVTNRLLEGPATLRQLGTALVRVCPEITEQYLKWTILHAMRSLRKRGYDGGFDKQSRQYIIREKNAVRDM